jgi:hypothetical protein
MHQATHEELLTALGQSVEAQLRVVDQTEDGSIICSSRLTYIDGTPITVAVTLEAQNIATASDVGQTLHWAQETGRDLSDVEERATEIGRVLEVDYRSGILSRQCYTFESLVPVVLSVERAAMRVSDFLVFRG